MEEMFKGEPYHISLTSQVRPYYLDSIRVYRRIIKFYNGQCIDISVPFGITLYRIAGRSIAAEAYITPSDFSKYDTYLISMEPMKEDYTVYGTNDIITRSTYQDFTGILNLKKDNRYILDKRFMLYKRYTDPLHSINGKIIDKFTIINDRNMDTIQLIPMPYRKRSQYELRIGQEYI